MSTITNMFKEDVLEFAERHGGMDSKVFVGGRYLFPDGASTDQHDILRGEPPLDPKAVNELKRLYLKTKLRNAVEQFNKQKAELFGQARNAAGGALPSPGGGAVAYLTEQKSAIEKLTEELAAVEAEIGEDPEVTRQRQIQTQLNERAEAARKLAAEINAITL